MAVVTQKVVDSRFKTYNPQYSHTFEWIIEHFSKLDFGTVIKSPDFETKHGSVWNASFRKISSEKSVLTFNSSSVCQTFLDVKIDLRDHKGITLHSPIILDYRAENTTIAFTFYHKKMVYNLYDPLISPGDTLVLVCEMSLKNKSLATVGYNPNSLKSDSGLKSLSHDQKNMYENPVGADISLDVQGVTILAHRFILVARSEVFAKMLSNNMKEKTTGIIEINDIEPNVFKLFLQYLYTGLYPDCDVNTAQALYRVANKYSVSTLKKEIVSDLVPKISSENAVSLLELADLYDIEILKSEVSAHIKFNLAKTLDKLKISNRTLSDIPYTELKKIICS